MDAIRRKMYQAAKKAQNERKIADYTDAGGAAAALGALAPERRI